MGINYRSLARTHLENADNQLSMESDLCLKYAALELRMSMEAITYDRAIAYTDEFPPSEYETWQPRKIMSVLLEIDPEADQDSSIAIGREEQFGVLAPQMNSLGTEIVLSMKVLKKHYDALGSYLHMQSMKKMRAGEVLDYEKFRNRCIDIHAYIEKVLSSPIFNITVGNFASLNCAECNSNIRKRIPCGQSEVIAKCYQCKATYTISDEGDDKVKWTPHQRQIECASSNCINQIVVWQNELEVGRHWRCTECGGENIFVLAVQHKEAPK